MMREEEEHAAMNPSQSDSEELSVSGGLDVDVDADDVSEMSSSSADDSSCSSSTSSLSETEDGQVDALEWAKIANDMFRLPRGLCENAAIFHQFFSIDTWNMLPESFQARLCEYLPNFSPLLKPQEAIIERKRSLAMLFNCKLELFNHTPMVDLQNQLEEGNCRPDVLQLRQSIAKSQRREARFQHCERLGQLAKQLFVSRERVLRIVYKSAPNTLVRSERIARREQAALHADSKLCSVRARNRFCKEMRLVAKELGLKANDLSADEEEDALNEAEEKPNLVSTLKTGTTPTDRCIYSTLFKRRHDLSDEETVCMDQQQRNQKLSNRNFYAYLREHKRRKLTEPSLPDFETSDIRLRDVCARAQMGNSFKHIFGVGKAPGRKPKAKLPPAASNEPPALVPIFTQAAQTAPSVLANEEPMEALLAQKEDLRSSSSVNNASGVSKQQEQSLQKNNGNDLHSHSFMPEDGTPFNILDGEVELQQEEVETYGNSEEVPMPQFVLSNEVVLPTIEESDIPPQKLLQTPYKSFPPDSKKQHSPAEDNRSSDRDRPNLPKLEPFAVVNKPTPNRDKVRPAQLPISNSNKGALAKKSQWTNGSRSADGYGGMYGSVSTNAELIQETHSCFFSLIRDFFCATPHHRMQYEDLKERIDIWLCNPITALNDWYAQAENWSTLLTSAINFLAGEFPDQPDEYVPYIEFKAQQNIYQWIGAGRDSDARLSSLCTHWLQRRHEVTEKPLIGGKHSDVAVATVAASLVPPLGRSADLSDEGGNVVYDGGISPPPPPPPRCPTTWTVCAATKAEIVEFQRQERERFEQPHRAYTYRMHNYESVVGPVKGIYSQTLALTKARGHSMMVVNRPNFVTILTLVRDATARLPNGEGTRADIAELLKSSQYINLKEGENVLQTTVSGALDRMHTEHDPCVRYDPKRKIWIYLHRNRTEDEFERMHQQYQGLGKCKKGATPRKSKTKNVSSAKTHTEGEDVSSANAGGGCGVERDNVATTTTSAHVKISTTFSLPALVPANPIIVNSQSPLSSQKQANLTQPPVTKSLPVPPLKYNIPQPQQKSLLKATLQTQQRHQLGSEHKPPEAVDDFSTKQQQRPLTHSLMTINNNTVTISQTQLTASGLNNKITFSMAQSKQVTGVTTTANPTATTPIVVATPAGLQTIHVSGSNVVSSASTLTTSPSVVHVQQNSATVSGKKVAISKPIVINQITAAQPMTVATNVKTKSPQQVLKQQVATAQQQSPHQQQQTTHSFIIPISVASAQGGASEETTRQQATSTASSTSDAAVFIGNQQLADNQAQPQQQQAKNIIRLVPAVRSGAGKQPVHVIGHRVIANNSNNANLRAQLQAKAIEAGCSISLNSAKHGNNAVVASTPGGSTVIKMSPQAFASLQQKQNQHILVKQAGQPQQQQQRVIVGNTAIMAQSAAAAAAIQTAGKKLVAHQQSSASHKTIATSSQASLSGGASAMASKIHTINASNLTTQQQRILIQNIRQQQQHQKQIQFKAVQVIPNAAAQPSVVHQVEQTALQQQTPQTATAQVGSKGVAVMVSQSQGLTRLIKQHQQQQQQQQKTVNISSESPQVVTAVNSAPTRLLTTSTGQIISLDALLQKQGGSLKISGTGVAAVASAKAATSTSGAYVQQQPTNANNGNNTYAVVSQPRSNIVTAQRVVTTQAALVSATAEGTTTKTIAASAGAAGRVIVSSSGQLTMPQIAKVLSNTSGAAGATVTASGSSIRVIKTPTGTAVAGTTSFNIANLQGKQVVFATKPAATKSIVTTVNGPQVQTQQIQAGSVILGGQTVKLQRNLNKLTGSSGVSVMTSQSGQQMQTVIMGNQILRVQQLPQQTIRSVASSQNSPQQRISSAALTTNANSNTSTSSTAVTTGGNESVVNASAANNVVPKALFIGSHGQTLRLQQQYQHQPTQPMSTQTQTQIATAKNVVHNTKTGNASRVVLAVQGGGQIFLSPTFQGNTLNLKSLQNMKVVSLASRQGSSGEILQQQNEKIATPNTSAAQQQQQTMLRNSSGSSV